MKVEVIKTRTQVVRTLRQVLTGMGFEEVVPVVMSRAIPTEPTIYPFVASWDRGQKQESMCLATSPEAYLKRVMAAGMGDCFTISPVFRNMEGEGQWHQPEFLMAEYYKENSDWEEMMEITQRVVIEVWEKLQITNYKLHINNKFQNSNFKNGWERLSWVGLWRKYVKVDLLELMTDEAMREWAEKHDYMTEGASWEQLFNQVNLNVIEPRMPTGQYFLVDFPARISPLCKTQKGEPRLAERFELVIGGVELANGNSELFDGKRVETMMEEEIKRRKAMDDPVSEIDGGFVEALDNLSGQEWAGVGLGVDRLAAMMAGTSVAEVQGV